MKIPPLRSWCRLCAGLAALPLHALEWERTLIEAKPAAGSEVVRVQFSYRNASEKVVRILGVSTSCGCTEASADASEVAPRGAGVLHVLFTIGQRSGPQEKVITVATDDAKQPVKLVLKVALPEKR